MIDLKNEEFELIEILEGVQALFIDARINKLDLPEGLYAYDLRSGDDETFASLEPEVIINHSGTVILKTPVDFGTTGFIQLDDDTRPNFLDCCVTLQEFIDNDTIDID